MLTDGAREYMYYVGSNMCLVGGIIVLSTVPTAIGILGGLVLLSSGVLLVIKRVQSHQ
jgi:hypothetical protein